MIGPNHFYYYVVSYTRSQKKTIKVQFGSKLAVNLGNSIQFFFPNKITTGLEVDQII